MLRFSEGTRRQGKHSSHLNQRDNSSESKVNVADDGALVSSSINNVHVTSFLLQLPAKAIVSHGPDKASSKCIYTMYIDVYCAKKGITVTKLVNRRSDPFLIIFSAK